MGQETSADLLTLLHDMARMIRVEADRRARVQGMTRAQWGLMLRLARQPGLSQKELADLLEVEPISVARLVDRMVAAGLVERQADAQDRRIWRLHLLPAATCQLAEINRQRELLAAEVLAGVPEAVRDALREGVQRMKLNLAQIDAASHYKENV
jgi:DNA-binding MarR family transcriptional regulator